MAGWGFWRTLTFRERVKEEYGSVKKKSFCSGINLRASFPRRRESSGETVRNTAWIPACAGMTIREFNYFT
jgi:hypothetical protein